jgi:putative ABC transport system ATP-binding protein
VSSSLEPAIVARDVRKTFDKGAVTALQSITMEVAAGEFVAITGPSGCGKSTLMHLFAALDRADSGELQVAGEDLFALSHPNRFRRDQVGIVFQMHNLLAHLDVLGNITVAMMGSATRGSQARERAGELLEEVGLVGLEHRRPPELSGGERQRVALARALANRPQILLADEPTGSLDSGSKALVLELMEKLRTEEQVTVVVVTHDDLTAAAADRVLHLFDGQVLDDT